MGAGKAIRKGLDRQRYLRSDEGKAEKKARKAHNKKFSPNMDKSTKKEVRKRAKASDAAKGATMRERDTFQYVEEMKDGGSLNAAIKRVKAAQGMKDGGAAKKLKEVPAGNKGKGLSKLPTEVRNKMGFMKDGGKVTPPKPLPKDSKNAKGRRLKRSPGNKNEAGGNPLRTAEDAIESLRKNKGIDKNKNYFNLAKQFEKGGAVCRGMGRAYMGKPRKVKIR